MDAAREKQAEQDWGFEDDGRTYRSLSAIASEVARTPEPSIVRHSHDLLEDVKSKRLDVVAVYTSTGSAARFSILQRIAGRLDRHKVSFASLTQQCNTNPSSENWHTIFSDHLPVMRVRRFTSVSLPRAARESARPGWRCCSPWLSTLPRIWMRLGVSPREVRVGPDYCGCTLCRHALPNGDAEVRIY
jgi:hypothetical protein